MDLARYVHVLKAAFGGELPLNQGQRLAVEHEFVTPLWVIAGPGTGKTHTLIWLVWKRLLVDGVAPDRIILTTFTRKAAAELESRLVLSRQQLVAAGCAEAEAVAVTRVNLGTLHSLCSQLLQDQRYAPTLHMRILEDELTQQFFVRRSHNPLLAHDGVEFWRRFDFLKLHEKYAPNRARRAEAACTLFNRMTENSVDVAAMAGSGDPDFTLLVAAYDAYREALTEKHRTDQALLQRHFVDYLGTPAGREWMGDGFTVVVDEYQDTNPIQEEIYFALAGARGDLAVVGDDDQSLYRFRGATVESLIDFDRACRIYLDKTPTPVYLHENRRSHEAIVSWVNRFIRYHPVMRDDAIRVRAPHKPKLVAGADVKGQYPAVMAIVEGTHKAAGAKMAGLVRGLKEEGLVSDYSQIAALSFSTRESIRAIGAYTEALHAAGIPMYNPRNRTAQKDRRVKALLGALCAILDPEFDPDAWHSRLPHGVVEYVCDVADEYAAVIAGGAYPELAAYVAGSAEAVRRQPVPTDGGLRYLERGGGRRVILNGLLYKLLAHEPFATDLTDLEGGERLKGINQILAEYESLYEDGELRLEWDEEAGAARIAHGALSNFYGIFIEGIHDGLNDPEDDEISIQPGAVNVMTIHQAKGLEFEVVFVLRPDKQPFVGPTHLLEDLLDPFITRPTKPSRRRLDELRAAEDAVRLFFVAYSRAKRLLVLTGTNLRGWERALGRDAAGALLESVAALQREGVLCL